MIVKYNNCTCRCSDLSTYFYNMKFKIITDELHLCLPLLFVRLIWPFLWIFFQNSHLLIKYTELCAKTSLAWCLRHPMRKNVEYWFELCTSLKEENRQSKKFVPKGGKRATNVGSTRAHYWKVINYFKKSFAREYYVWSLFREKIWDLPVSLW